VYVEVLYGRVVGVHGAKGAGDVDRQGGTARGEVTGVVCEGGMYASELLKKEKILRFLKYLKVFQL